MKIICFVDSDDNFVITKVYETLNKDKISVIPMNSKLIKIVVVKDDGEVERL